MGLRYSTRGAYTFTGKTIERCSICDFPLNNGFQLVCEPGVCRYRERPIRYEAPGTRRTP